jgi:tetratricopeptide (TPR) repeat protein
MNKVAIVISLLPILATSAALSAQKDSITLTDGTTIRNVKVLSWNAKEIKFKTRKGNDSRPSYLVVDARVQKIQEALLRAGTDPGVLITEAETHKADALIASYALYKAAMGYLESNETSTMISALQKIDTDYPDSPFAPAYYQWKIKYYLTKKKPDHKSAATTAVKYGDASRTRTWSAAYQLDSEYWGRLIEGVSGKVQAPMFINNMKNLMGKADSVAPFVAHAAAADLADAYRKGKKYEEAKAEYEKLQEKKGLNADVRARMYLGLGYISLEAAIAGKDEAEKKSDYHEAYKNFLRVFLNAKSANADLVAEGLYNAAKACEQWNELPTCRVMAGKLRGRLKFHKPYKFTSWASKK